MSAPEMSYAGTLDQIRHYQKDIDNCPENNRRVLRCIQRLFVLPVKVSHLEETGIGKSVNTLRKYGGEVGLAAKALVTKWKGMVASQECSDNEKEDRSASRSPVKEDIKSLSRSCDKKDKYLKENDSNNYYNGREKRSRDTDSSDRNSDGKEKRLKTNDIGSKERRSNEKDYRHHSSHNSVQKSSKSSAEKSSSHHRDRRSKTDKHVKEKRNEKHVETHRRDKHKEKEHQEDKYYNSSTNKSSHRNLNNRDGKKRHGSCDSAEESDNTYVKRKRHKSPTYSEDGDSDTRQRIDEETSAEENSEDEGEEKEYNEEEEAEEKEDDDDDDDDDSDDEEVRPNPYLNSFIKDEPDSSEYENDAMQVDDNGESENEKDSRSCSESEGDSENEEQSEVDEEKHSRREYEQERIDNEENEIIERLSAGSESEEETEKYYSNKKTRENKGNRVSSDATESDDEPCQNKKPHVKQVDYKKRENHKPEKEREHKQKHSSSLNNDRHHSQSSRSNSSRSSNNQSHSKTKYSSQESSSSSSSSSSKKLHNGSASCSNMKSGNKSESDKNKENRSSHSSSEKDRKKGDAGSTEDKHKSKSSSLTSSSNTKDDKTRNTMSSKSSSSSKDKTHRTGRSAASASSNTNNSSSSHKIKSVNHISNNYQISGSSSGKSTSSKSRSSSEPVEEDYLNKVIKKEPEDKPTKLHKIQPSTNSSGKKSNGSDVSNVKIKEEKIKVKTEKFSDNEDGIDGGSGASFADALLGMSGSKVKSQKKKPSLQLSSPKKPSTVSPPFTAVNNKQSQLSHSSKQTSSSQSKSNTSLTQPDLLQTAIKLEPLDIDVASTLPEISPNYHPIPHYSPPYSNMLKKNKAMTQEEALSSIMSSKNQRTKVFSGNRYINTTHIPTLFDLCIQVLHENIQAIEYTGGVPYDILEKLLKRASAEDLLNLEKYNPYLIEDTDGLWQFHCNKKFRGKQREEMESWRDLYVRCIDEQSEKLKKVTENITQSIAQSIPVRKTKLAYVDSFVKPPRNIAKKQEKYGTSAAVKHDIVAKATIGAVSGSPTKTVVPAPSSRSNQSSALLMKKKKAPLMLKTLQFMKGNRFKR